MTLGIYRIWKEGAARDPHSPLRSGATRGLRAPDVVDASYKRKNDAARRDETGGGEEGKGGRG